MHKVRNDEIMKIFGKNVLRVRLLRGMTQEQLAEDAKISQVQVARIESGKLNTSISTLYAIASALKVSECEFFKEN